MALFERNSGWIEADLTGALQNPIRLRILELFGKDEGRSTAVKAVTADLRTYFPNVKARRVAYHLAVLRDARLIPPG